MVCTSFNFFDAALPLNCLHFCLLLQNSSVCFYQDFLLVKVLEVAGGVMDELASPISPRKDVSEKHKRNNEFCYKKAGLIMQQSEMILCRVEQKESVRSSVSMVKDFPDLGRRMQEQRINYMIIKLDVNLWKDLLPTRVLSTTYHQPSFEFGSIHCKG
ncbi:hypothetical protein Ahy_B02g060657 [Arachis hypogaea]|uniref:Uncharacterized protein n=1 Tax=Arachis hypogaea TaxID=3818 RepID=A0A445AIZ1_ARAHY|nr:hypothetical protein Ahy_B02g060657 [Arachis hypogaea]